MAEPAKPWVRIKRTYVLDMVVPRSTYDSLTDEEIRTYENNEDNIDFLGDASDDDFDHVGTEVFFYDTEIEAVQAP